MKKILVSFISIMLYVCTLQAQQIDFNPTAVDQTAPIGSVEVAALPDGFADASLVIYTWTLTEKPATSNPILTPTKFSNRGVLKLEDLSGTLPIGVYVLTVVVRAAGGVSATGSIDIIIRPRNNAKPIVSWSKTDATVKVASQSRATTAYNTPYPTFKLAGFISDPLDPLDTYWRVIHTNTSNSPVYNNALGAKSIPAGVTQTEDSLRLNNLMAGTYEIYLVAQDALGAKDSARYTLTVTDPVNTPPVVNVMANAVIKMPTTNFTLTGSATDADGTITATAWSFVSGPSTVVQLQQGILDVSNLQTGEYIFRFTATDNRGGSAFADVRVTVNERDNTAPVAKLPKDTVLIAPANGIVINGAATDAEGGLLVFKWEQLSGEPIQWTAQNDNQTCIINGLVIGEYVMQLTVTDAKGLSSVAKMKISVRTGATAEALTAQKVLSPNGDNKNDDWKIVGIEAFPELDVTVINEKGQTVFRKKSYINDQAWDGTKNGRGLPEGAYFYLIRDNTDSIIKRGSFVLMR
jgi:gliding motility-associated-like protein